MTAPLATVAICTWNRAQLLDDTLTGLAAVRVPPGLTWEVLVIDNNSTDNTQQVLAKHVAAGNLPLRHVFESKQGHSNARNCGIENARGDWILWTDDDVKIDTDWLEGFVAAIGRHPDVAALGGVIEPWFPVPPDPDLCAAFPVFRSGFCGIDHGPEERVLPVGWNVFGANMGYHRGRTAGLRFEPTLGRSGAGLMSGDDVEFQARVRAAGGSVLWAPGMRLAHFVEPSRMTLDYLCRFYRALGRTGVKADGRPEGPYLFGAPRYMVKAIATNYLGALVRRLTGPRAARFQHLRLYNFYRGIVLACWRKEYPGGQTS